jgi:phospholipase C
MRLRCRVSRFPLVALLALAASLTAGCSAGSSSALIASPAGRVPFERHAQGRIQHIVIIIQENESFDHFFNGYPGADTVSSGPIHTGQVVPLTIQNLGDATNSSHYASDFLADYDAGKLNGFDLNTNSPSPNLLPYTYVDPSQLGPYWQMAGQYVLADKYFTSHVDASFVGHQYLIAAQANRSVNLPTSLWGCPGGPNDVIPTLNADRTIGSMEPICMDYQTLGDELDAAGLSWRFYSPVNSSWSAYQAINHIYNGPDWPKDVINPETQILTDIPSGLLANVTWVVPINCNSDHPGSRNGTCPQPAGPQWVADIVNAVGQSPFWDSTEIFVTWDEWGGEYDHVKPPMKDYDGDGFRVPLLCISPYAYQGKVNHTALEAAGIPKFVEQTFGLATLSAADERAKSADKGCTNPKQKTPRQFQPISSSLSPNYFLHVQKRKVYTPPYD